LCGGLSQIPTDSPSLSNGWTLFGGCLNFANLKL